MNELLELADILQSKKIAKESIQRYGSARQTLRAGDEELLSLGVKPRTLARLRTLQRMQIAAPEANCASVIVAEFGPRIANLNHEVFCVVCLTAVGGVQGFFEVAKGGRGSVSVDPTCVFRPAILNNATCIVVMHNHPSGQLEPSTEDLEITKRLVACGRILGVPVVDHIIVTATNCTSLAFSYPHTFEVR